jgi:hypothetical protein
VCAARCAHGRLADRSLTAYADAVRYTGSSAKVHSVRDEPQPSADACLDAVDPALDVQVQLCRVDVMCRGAVAHDDEIGWAGQARPRIRTPGRVTVQTADRRQAAAGRELVPAAKVVRRRAVRVPLPGADLHADEREDAVVRALPALLARAASRDR